MGNKTSKGNNPNDPEPNPNDPDLGIKTRTGQGTKHQSQKQITTGLSSKTQSQEQIQTGQNTTNQSKKKIQTGQNTTTQTQKKIRTGQTSQKQIRTGQSSKTQKGELQIPDSQQIQQLQLSKKPDQTYIRKGEYSIVYKKNNQEVVRKVPTFIRSEGIAGTIRELQKIQNNFQEIIINQSQTGENIGRFIIAKNEIQNYNYINEHNEIKHYFPFKIKNIGIVPYIEFLEGYITFEDFIKDSKIDRRTKNTLMKKIVGILRELHDNGFYHRGLYSLENIMIFSNSEDSSTYDVKFIGLGLSLNNESIQKYSKDHLDLLLNVDDHDFVGVSYFHSVKYFLENFQALSVEERLAMSSRILRNADLCMFLVSCHDSLTDGEKDSSTRVKSQELRIINYDDLSSRDINSIIDYTIV